MDPDKDKTDQPTAVPNNQGVVPPVPPPVGGLAKEVGPLSQEKSLSEKGPEISAEVSQAPQTVQEHTQANIRVSQRPIEPVATTTPVSFKSPLTQAEMVAAKKSRITDAIAWLAGTILRQIKRSKFNQKQSLSKQI